MASKEDFKLASLAAGFAIGFGLLTVWKAIKQTMANKSPIRSAYIYMIWGEVVSNLCFGIIAWLCLSGSLGPSIVVLFSFVFFWVFQTQLLMQIIINRIAIIADSKKFVKKLKWGTVIIVSMMNISVFCIWIPAHTDPPASGTYVKVNKIWDPIASALICIVDAGLNWCFLRSVKVRLVKDCGLLKYAPLVSFNARLMVVSIFMDLMLIGLMHLPNELVYCQFYPVAYMVKLNIEMTMATLIARIARGQDNDMRFTTDSHSHNRTGNGTVELEISHGKDAHELQSYTVAGKSPILFGNKASRPTKGILQRTEVRVEVDELDGGGEGRGNGGGSAEGAWTAQKQVEEDEMPLRHPEAAQRRNSKSGVSEGSDRVRREQDFV